MSNSLAFRHTGFRYRREQRKAEFIAFWDGLASKESTTFDFDAITESSLVCMDLHNAVMKDLTAK